MKRKMGWKEKEGEVLAGLTEARRKFVRENVNLEPDNDLAKKSRAELLRMFPHWVKEPKKRKRLSLNDRACVMTLIWQWWLKIMTGEIPVVDGNIRTMWYKLLEPFYIEKDLLVSDLSPRAVILSAGFPLFGPVGVLCVIDPGPVMLGLGRKDPAALARLLRSARETYLQNLLSLCLDEFVMEGIFRFQGEFRFWDPRPGWRLIGRRRRRIILFTEKEGLWWLCEYAWKKHGITVVASQGEAGLLALEYLYDDLQKAGVGSVVIISVNDWDPWGRAIGENFADKMRLPIFFGPGNVEMRLLIGTQDGLKRLFTPKEIERGKRDLRNYSQYKQSQVEEWVALTGGIGGEPYGIHIDLADRERLCAQVDEWVASASGKKGCRRGSRGGVGSIDINR